MKISVVTISYNQARYLPQCIESVLAQKGVEVEYIIVDPGSTDNSRKIIAGYSPRLARTIFEPDKGPADGLNKGFDHATGDIFYYLNSDDVVLPGAFQQAALAFERYPDVDVVYGDGIQIDAEGRRQTTVYASPSYSRYGHLCGGVSLLQQATFIRAAAYRRVGGFNISNRTCWDGELLLELARAGAIFKHLPRLLGAFRIHEEAITGSGRLNDEYSRYQKTLFHRHMGRDRSTLDDLAKVAFWSVRKASAVTRPLKYRRNGDCH